MESEQNYVSRMVAEALERGRALDRAPLAERKEACAELTDAMANRPAIVAERLDWLLAGHYGRGEYERAWMALGAGGRSNREANLMQLVAMYEWSCPSAMTRKAWKDLTTAQKGALSSALVEVMARHIALREAEGK